MRAGGGGCYSDPTTIFVKGFSRDLEESDVRQQLTDAFAECGEVAGVRLPTDRETGALKGIAFIEFASAEGKVRRAHRSLTLAVAAIWHHVAHLPGA